MAKKQNDDKSLKPEWVGIYYVNYIEKNPLYIHNHAQYYNNTIDNLDRLAYDPVQIAKKRALDYIDLLERKENQIFSNINGNPDEILTAIAKDAYVTNENIPKINKLLDKVFYMNQPIKAFVTSQAIFKIIGKDPNTGQNVDISIQLSPTGKNKHGHNVYNFTEELAKLDPTLKANLEIQLKNIVDSINKAISFGKGVNSEFEKLLSKSEFTRATTSNLSAYCNYYNEAMRIYGKASPTTEEIWKFIVDRSGKYRITVGDFNEGCRINFSQNVADYFETSIKNIFNERADPNKDYWTNTGKLGKVDTIIYGGKIKEAEPITISRKNTSIRDVVKFHTGSLQSVYEALTKDPQLNKIASVFLYINLNNPFFYNQKAVEKNKEINRYLNYLFLSGFTKGKEALYLAITGPDGNNKQITHFIRFSDIIKTIIGEEGYESEIPIKTNFTMSRAKSKPNISDGLWYNKLWKTKQKVADARRKRTGKSGMKYQYLAPNKKIQSVARTLANDNGLFTKERRYTVNYDLLEQIALRHGIL